MNGYPVRWRGRKLTASDLTDDLKNGYCVWLYNYMLDNARERMTVNAYRAYENQLTAAPPEWTSLPDRSVLAALDPNNTRREPKRQLTRMILGLKLPEDDPEAGMSEEELDELIAEKSADPDSDLNRAMRLVREGADPKARRGEPGSPPREAESEPTPLSAGATLD